MIEERSLEIAFQLDLGDGQEVEKVRVFRDLLSQLPVRPRNGAVEVRDRLARTLVQARFDLVDQDVPAPTGVDRLLGVPDSSRQILQFVEQHLVVAPRELCSAALHNLQVWPRSCERPRVLEIAR